LASTYIYIYFYFYFGIYNFEVYFEFGISPLYLH